MACREVLCTGYWGHVGVLGSCIVMFSVIR